MRIFGVDAGYLERRENLERTQGPASPNGAE